SFRPDPGSPAINAGDNASCLATDQRNAPRSRTAADACDVGSIEVDGSPPVLGLPSDITAEATGPTGAVVTYSATATANVDGSVPVTWDGPGSGTVSPLATTTVHCSATDSSGNTATGSFHVTVHDTTGPSFTAPANQTVEATGPGGASATYTTPTATDAVDETATVSHTPASST